MRGMWTMSVPMFRGRGKGIGFILVEAKVGVVGEDLVRWMEVEAVRVEVGMSSRLA